MTITLEIEEDKLNSILQWTGQPQATPALATALDEYLAHKRRLQAHGQWLAELAHLRASVGPARSGAPTTEEILEELRAERVP